MMQRTQLPALLACCLAAACFAQGTIDSINDLSAPYIFGEFSSLPHAVTSISCAATGIDCHISIQRAGQCEHNLLTLSNFVVPSGSTALVNITKVDAVIGRLYELCLHPHVASTNCVGTSMYYVLMPNISSIAGVSPLRAATGYRRPYVVAPFQQQGALPISRFSAFQINLTIPAASSTFPSEATVRFALLPTCDYNTAIAEYLLLNGSSSSSSVAPVRSASGTSYLVSFTYPQLFHLWNMLRNNVGPSSSVSPGSLLEGRICATITNYQMNASFTLSANATAVATSYPLDLGTSVRLATNFRIGGARLYREEDTTSTGASGSTTRVRLMAGAGGGASPFLFDGVSSNAPTSLSALTSALASDQSSGTMFNLSVSMDIRDPAYPCETHSTSASLSIQPPSSNLRYAPVFATGAWSLSSSLVSWSTLVNRTFPGNELTASSSGVGGANGLLCVYIFNIPVLSLHVGGGVYSLMIEAPTAVLNTNDGYLVAAQGGSAALAQTIAVSAALNSVNVDLTFNTSAIAPSISTLRFTASNGACEGISSSSAVYAIVSTTTRFLEVPAVNWFALFGLRRLCVAVVLNASDTLPYYFQDFAVPSYVVVTAFSRISKPLAGSTDPSVRFFVPLNAPSFAVPLTGFPGSVSPYPSGRLSITFASEERGCLNYTLASSSVSSLTSFGSGAAFGVAAGLTSQLGSLSTRFPAGIFSLDDKSYICVGDALTIASPASPLPLLTTGVRASFYSLFVATKGVNVASSSMVMTSTGLPLLVLYVHPTLGLRIPITIMLRTGTSASLWSLSAVLGSVRLSTSSGSPLCGSSAHGDLSLVTSWSSKAGADTVHITGEAVELNQAAALASTGLHYVCFHSLPDALFADQEALYSRTSFPIGVVSFSRINGVDVSNGPNTTAIGVIQFVSFEWEVIGSGFSSAGIMQMLIGGVIASNSIAVVNDTHAVFTFRPQTAGVQQVNATLGVTLSHVSYAMISIDVVGVAAVGIFGSTFTAMIAGSTATHAIALTSEVQQLPSVCLATSVSSSSACSCVADANVTMPSATELFVDLSLTNESAIVGRYPICFKYNSALHFTTGYSVVVLPQLKALGGTLASSGNNNNISFVRGTAPSIIAAFGAPIPSEAASLRLVMYDVDDAVDLGGSSNCNALSNRNSTTVNSSNVISIDYSQGIGSSTTVANVPLQMTSNTQTSGRRLCSALVVIGTFSSSGASLSRFVHDFQISVILGTLLINGIALNSGTNVTTPILSQANTTLEVSLPSFVASTTFLQFGVASSSCASLPTEDGATDALNQTVSVAGLTLQFSSVGGSTANLTIPAGIRSSSGDLLFCARWLESASYAFTGLFVAALYVSAFDRQTVTTNTTSQTLSMEAGTAVMRNATRLVTLEGERINAACLRVVFLPTRTAVCSEAGNLVFQGSLAQTTQQFSVSSTSAADYASMCLLIYRSCSPRQYPAVLFIDAPVSILSFEAFDIDSTTLTNLNQQQSELMAIVGIPMTNTLYRVDASYSMADVASLPFVELLAQPSSSTSCLRTSSIYRFEVEEVVDGGGLTTLGIITNIPEAPSSSTSFTVCMLRNVSATDQRYLALGMTLLVSSLTMGGSSLALGNTVSLTVNKAPELVVTGSNLNLLLLYFALTDTGSCSSATLSGTNDVGIERTPSTVVSCSSSKGSVTFTSASNQTDTPLALCVAGVPSSSGKATALSLTFYPANLSVAVTQALSLSVVTEPSSVASSDGSLSTEPVLGIRAPDSSLIQNVPSGIIITASWVAVSPYVAVESICDLCKITTDGENFLLTSTSSPSLFSNAKFGVQYVLNYTPDRSDIEPIVTTTVKRGLCPVTQFGSLYSTQCEDCLSSAYCTGDVDYTLRSSFWRANNKTNFIYDCSPPYGASQCIGNTSTGTCTEGHNGPRCTICDPGYGKSFDVCVPCSGYGESLATVVALALGYIALVIVATFSSVNGMDDKRDTKHLPVLIKLLATHLAMASTVGEFSSQFPALLDSFFSGMRSTSRPSPQFASLDCSIAPTAYQSFLFLILIPIPTLFLVLGGSFVVRLIHYIRDDLHEKDKAVVASLRESVLKERSVRQATLAAASRRYMVDEVDETSPDDSPVASPVRRRATMLPPQSTEDEAAGGGGGGGAETSESHHHPPPSDHTEHPLEENDIAFATFDEIPIVTDEERELMHAEDDLEDYKQAQKMRLDTKTLFLLALVVVLLFGYPTIVEQSLNMLKCDTIEFGEIQPNLAFVSEPKKLYFYDRSLECTSSDHQFYTLLAYLAVAVYGIGIPVASIGLVIWFRKNKGVTYTNRLFVFLVCGYDDERWWWETIVLWRKLALAFVLVFIDDQRLQTYAALWILMTALALQMWLEPYDEVSLDRLATASLVIVIVTLNLSLLYDYMPEDSTSYNVRVGNVLLTIGLFVINAVLVFILVGLIIIHGLLEVQYQISTNAKFIRRVLPLSMQNCLFRFARKPLVTFHKILKKREREKDRKNRIKHVINDADGELVDVVIMGGTNPIGKKSPGLTSPSNGPLEPHPAPGRKMWDLALSGAGALKSPAPSNDLNVSIGNHAQVERQKTRVLREALRREEVFVRDLLKKYESVVYELDALRGQERGQEDLQNVKNEFDRIVHLASNPPSNLVSPAQPALPPPPQAAPELVVEDLTIDASPVRQPLAPSGASSIMLSAMQVSDIDAWSPSAPTATSEGNRRGRLATLPESQFASSVSRRSQLKPKLRAEIVSVIAAADNVDGEPLDGSSSRQDEDQFVSLNDTQRASKYKLHLSSHSDSKLGSTISAKSRKKIERALGESTLLGS